MASTDPVLELLEFINPEAYCDDCLSSEIGIDQIPLIFRKQVRVLTHACFHVFPECKRTGHAIQFLSCDKNISFRFFLPSPLCYTFLFPLLYKFLQDN
jgi:hypothetical protein